MTHARIAQEIETALVAAQERQQQANSEYLRNLEQASATGLCRTERNRLQEVADDSMALRSKVYDEVQKLQRALSIINSIEETT